MSSKEKLEVGQAVLWVPDSYGRGPVTYQVSVVRIGTQYVYLSNSKRVLKKTWRTEDSSREPGCIYLNLEVYKHKVRVMEQLRILMDQLRGMHVRDIPDTLTDATVKEFRIKLL